MLHEFLTTHHDEIVRRSRAKVATRHSPQPTEGELEHGVLVLLGQIGDELLRAERVSSPEISRTAGERGRELLRAGFTISQVVHDYGDVCQVVTQLAVELKAPITTEEFHTLNRCLDDAIAGAVSAFSEQKETATAKTATERLGFLAHELRNLLGTATMSFAILRRGTVAVGGSTGAVHERALKGLRVLIDRTLTEVRLDAGIEHHELVSVRQLVEEVETTASLEATASGHRLSIVNTDREDLAVDIDRAIVASVLANLLQNAFKFSHPDSSIVLRVRSTAERVLLDVEDECGGLPMGKADDLFLSFERRSTNRTGLGLGLSISREGTQASGGELRVRDVPGYGCVFTVDLPRKTLPKAP